MFHTTPLQLLTKAHRGCQIQRAFFSTSFLTPLFSTVSLLLSLALSLVTPSVSLLHLLNTCLFSHPMFESSQFVQGPLLISTYNPWAILHTPDKYIFLSLFHQCLTQCLKNAQQIIAKKIHSRGQTHG